MSSENIINDNESQNKNPQTVQVDAAHPRFRKQYQCMFCNQNFEPTLEGLNDHFRGTFHKSEELCDICRSTVFSYINTKKERKHYFTCNCHLEFETKTVTEDKNCVRKTKHTTNDL